MHQVVHQLRLLCTAHVIWRSLTFHTGLGESDENLSDTNRTSVHVDGAHEQTIRNLSARVQELKRVCEVCDTQDEDISIAPEKKCLVGANSKGSMSILSFFNRHDAVDGVGDDANVAVVTRTTWRRWCLLKPPVQTKSPPVGQLCSKKIQR